MSKRTEGYTLLDGNPGGYRGTRPSRWSLSNTVYRGGRLCTIVSLVCVLSIISVSSLVFVFFDGKYPTTLEELTLDLFDPVLPTQPGWLLFKAIGSSRVKGGSHKERETLAEAFFSSKCREEWIASGTICKETTHPKFQKSLRDALKLSVVHTWVNGSDEHLMQWKDSLAAGAPANRLGRPIGDAARHFRAHGELQYSMRSVVASLPPGEVAGLHLITTDLPLVNTTRRRIGQIPTWLDVETVCTPHIYTHHHWELYKSRGRGHNETEALAWKSEILPTFNSIGIETQLPSLAPELTDTFIYFNDDFFLTQHLTRSDFSSPLFGTVFRMQRDLLVGSSAMGKSGQDPEGEWPSLEFSNWLLDQRFGARKRPYLQHFAKAFSSPLMEEVAAIWGEELTGSAEIRFRGGGHGKALGLPYLATHYVVERHREALLWSFIIARSDRDHSGTFSSAERTALLAEIGYTHDASSEESVLDVPMAVREPKEDSMEALEMVGLDAALSTHYSFTSQRGGYPYVWTDLPHKPGQRRPTPPEIGWPRYEEVTNGEKKIACSMDVAQCFGEHFVEEGGEDMSVEDVFKRIAFENPRCGDCVMQSLLGASGKSGFSAFLPESSWYDRSSPQVALPLSKNFTDTHYDSLGGRARAVSLLQRYSYTIGDSPAEFIALHPDYTMKKKFDRLSASSYTGSGTAFVALNDELPEMVTEKQLSFVDPPMQEWFRTLWPDKMCGEV